MTWLKMSLTLGMLALGLVMLSLARDDSWRQATGASENLAIALERDIAHNIANYDISLSGVISALQMPGIDQASPTLRQAALFDKAATASYLGSILVLDAAGNVILGSMAEPPKPINLSDRDHFTIHRDHPDIGLYISRPVGNRLTSNHPVIALTRRINDANGRFAGTVSGGMRLDYFQDLFAKLQFGTKGSVTLLRTDGRVLARYPYNEADIDSDFSQTPPFAAMIAAASGEFIGTGKDGEQRLYTFRHVGNLPLILDIGTSIDDIYAIWRHKAAIIGSLLAGLCAATLALCHLFQREMRRRVATESDLMKTNDELTTLATTDALTELDNRRSFDSKLDSEWRRAIRSTNPLALVMIDVDCFKSYNDEHGHQKGDRVLQSIADCLRENIRNGGDFAARYGGEEFVVILPDTPMHRAEQVADRVRAAVVELAIPHCLTPTGHVTVSIGLAIGWPANGGTPDLVLSRADKALYQAKQQGRNRVYASKEALLF